MIKTMTNIAGPPPKMPAENIFYENTTRLQSARASRIVDSPFFRQNPLLDMAFRLVKPPDIWRSKVHETVR